MATWYFYYLHINHPEVKPRELMWGAIKDKNSQSYKNQKKDIFVKMEDDIGANSQINDSLHDALLKRQYVITRSLLARGAEVNLQDENGDTPLHIAVRLNDVDIVEELLSHGADCNIPNQINETPFCTAVYSAFHEIIKMFLTKDIYINIDNYLQGQPYLYISLIVAIQMGNCEQVGLLVDNGADVNEKDFEGDAPLHHAAWHKERKAEIVKVLIEKGAKINSQNCRGETALHKAVKCENLEVVEELINTGALVNLPNTDGETPLHYVIQHTKYHTLLRKWKNKGIFMDGVIRKFAYHEDVDLPTDVDHTFLYITRKLLDSQADVNLQTKDGYTPLHLAALINNIIGLIILLEKGACAKIKEKRGNTALHFAVQSQTTENVCNPTALHFAVQSQATENSCNPSFIDRFINNRTSEAVELLNAQNDKGEVPLHLAIHEYHYDASMVAQLIRNGASANIQDKNGDTPLHKATKLLNVIALRDLINKGAQLNIQNLEGDTPLHLAAQSSFRNPKHSLTAFELLLDKGAKIFKYNTECRTPIDELFPVRPEFESVVGKHLLILRVARLSHFVQPFPPFIDPRLERACLIELQKMETIKLSGEFSLIDLFSNYAVPKYLSNAKLLKELNSLFKSSNFIIKHALPLYANILKNTFEESKRRISLIRLASDSSPSNMRKSQFWRLPELVRLEIVHYLSNEDLESLIKSKYTLE